MLYVMMLPQIRKVLYRVILQYLASALALVWLQTVSLWRRYYLGQYSLPLKSGCHLLGCWMGYLHVSVEWIVFVGYA